VSEQSFVQKLAAGPVQFLLDRGVQQSETARGLCTQLEGKILQVSTGIAALDAHVTVSGGQLQLLPGSAEHADATISGSPLQLSRMLAGDPQDVIRSGDVKISGATEIAEDFQTLLYLTRPDIEEEVSRVTGDVIAHEIGQGVQRFSDWASRAERTMSRSMGEYLSEEARAVVSGPELEAFCADVDQLAAAVDRSEAKLQLLRRNKASAQAHNPSQHDQY
jgi:ubiquinone biosynthesis protein UbiJ